MSVTRRLEKKISSYCDIHNITTDKMWIILVAKYEEIYNEDLFRKRFLYINDNNIKYISMPEFLEKMGVLYVLRMKNIVNKYFDN